MEARMDAAASQSSSAASGASGTRNALIVFAGPSLTGKTTLGRGVSMATGIRYIDVDDVKQDLYPDARVLMSREVDMERMFNSYGEMYRRAKERLASGESVILIGTHRREIYRDMVYRLAQEAKVPLIMVIPDLAKISDPVSFISERIKRREAMDDSASALRGPGAFEIAIDAYRNFPLLRREKADHFITVDPAATTEDRLGSVLPQLRQYLRHEPPRNT